MEVVLGKSFQALLDKAGLSARLVAVAVGCSHVTIYSALNGRPARKLKLTLWAFQQILLEQMHYGRLPLKEVHRKHRAKILEQMFGEWLVERVEFTTKELRPKNADAPNVDPNEFVQDAPSDPIVL